MNDKILFSEHQKFRQTWLWIAQISLLGVPYLILQGVIQQVVHGKPWGNNPMSNSGLIIFFVVMTVIMISLIVLFWITCLKTSITDKKISVKFFPFHRSFQHYKWEDVANASVQRINPMKYGGWGLRFQSGSGIRVGFDGIKLTNYWSKIIYSISGRDVLQLELKNGKKVLIGTRKAKELEAVVYKIERKSKEY